MQVSFANFSEMRTLNPDLEAQNQLRSGLAKIIPSMQQLEARQQIYETEMQNLHDFVAPCICKPPAHFPTWGKHH